VEGVDITNTLGGRRNVISDYTGSLAQTGWARQDHPKPMQHLLGWQDGHGGQVVVVDGALMGNEFRGTGTVRRTSQGGFWPAYRPVISPTIALGAAHAWPRAAPSFRRCRHGNQDGQRVDHR